MCIRLNKLAQVKLSSATLKTNICGTQTLVKYQHYHHHQHQHRNVSKNIRILSITNHISTVPRQGSSFLLGWGLIFASTFYPELKLCLLCAACHLSSETWYNLSQSTNSEKKKIDIDVRIMETQFVNIFGKILIQRVWFSFKSTVSFLTLIYRLKESGDSLNLQFAVRKG